MNTVVSIDGTDSVDFTKIGGLDEAAMIQNAKDWNPYVMQEFLEQHIRTNEGAGYAAKVRWSAECLVKYQGAPIVPLRPNEKILPSRKNADPKTTTKQNYAATMTTGRTVRKAFGPDGPYYGHNLGLAMGQHPVEDKPGLCAMDIDKHDVDGYIGWKGLIEENGPVSGPVQSTPSGGQHIVMLWMDGFRTTTTELAPGVDTKGGKSTGRPSGHICVYPSIIDGKRYKWMGWTDPQPVPSWLLV